MSNPPIYVRVPPLLHQKVGEIAAAYGRKRPGWVADLLETVINGHALLSKDELDALSESNRQLAAFGNNLNQVARAWNVARKKSGQFPGAEEPVSVSLLRRCKAELDRHTKAVEGVIAQAKVQRVPRRYP